MRDARLGFNVAKILIVDDDKRVTDLVARQFAAGGHTCAVLSNGAEVLNTLARGDFDLLILDVMLPGMSGFEICRRVRRDPNLYTLPIVIVTAMSSEEEVMHGLAQGADDYIVKPFDIANLVQRVEALLRASAEGQSSDALTTLPSGDTTKRELQRRAIAHEAFALGYAELLGIREFAYRCGPEARMKAIRHFARALDTIGKELNPKGFFVGHMGGGHFVCILPPKEVEKYCNAVTKLWDRHLEEFYASIGKQKVYENGIAYDDTSGRDPMPLLDVLICVTLHGRKQPTTPQGMFETLSQIRHKAQSAKKGGVYFDRRT